MLHAVVFRSGDYQKVVQSWWTQWHGHPVLNENVLARLGVAVLDETGPVAVTHLYPASTASVVWTGFTVRAPHLSAYKAGRALKLLLAEAEETVRRMGYSILYTGYDNKALQKLCKREGYHEGSHVIEQWKVVR
jgi:hypothetical protein